MRGFTLIELMIVLAIMAILAMLGMGTLQDYLVRARLMEGLMLLSAARNELGVFVLSEGRLPSGAELALPPVTGRHVASLQYGVRGAQGILWVVVTGTGSQADGRAFALVATTGSDGLHWVCRGGDADGANPVPPRFLPAGCRDNLAR